LKEIPDNIKENLTIRPVKWMDDVLEIALERMPAAQLQDTPDKAEKATTVVPKKKSGSAGKDQPVSPH